MRQIPLIWKLYWLYWKLRFWLEVKRVYQLDTELIDFGDNTEPDLGKPVSQLCTANQFFSPHYKYWCKEMGSPPRFARKQWEFVYIMQVLSIQGMINTGKKGLGFGCGAEPMPGIFAKHGCSIVATDLSREAAIEQGWVDTLQHANDLDDLYNACNRIMDKDDFLSRVTFENVDMNNIPENLTDFDFVWSACAFEHLGSLRHGMEFVKASIKCLKPGGVAVHTTEFNLSSNEDTFETEGCSVYRKKDICQLVDELGEEGCQVVALNFNYGSMEVDKYIDIPPYGFSPHLKLQLEKYVITSIGLIIKRNL